ncbi:hypothetical protein HPB49_000865 [Dermacentor silvarum]|uniref:Uncharacterized protein n=1 Tax=Dermacentor silvarum TaxID=543639 RepID=A0ACB8CUB1_DERSI|nr:hypothetical protein HPB49_000865 [Dermacentor silvarum]
MAVQTPASGAEDAKNPPDRSRGGHEEDTEGMDCRDTEPQASKPMTTGPSSSYSGGGPTRTLNAGEEDWQTVLTLRQLRAAREERRGPVFTRAPPERVEFLNSSQAVVPCEAQGVPHPEVWWWRVGSEGPAPDIPGLRHVREHDGALVFSPFRAEDFRQDIHAAVYRCGARNSVGSVVSGDVHVRAGECNFYARSTESYSEAGRDVILH